LSFQQASAINPAFRRPADQGCRGGDGEPSARSGEHFRLDRPVGLCPNAEPKESKMPKLKTKSGAKKRFRITASGKVKSAMAGKRHGMIKRTKKQIRQHRGTRVMFKADGDNIIQYFLPNG
jgi:large subunit ribosomal protein L35